jgi:DNA-binding transcriptional LysR family regulator
MDLQRLKYFLAVAEELHFGRAAERARITPSPLSKQIRLLERELGGDLFIRDYHEVRLTPLGAAMVGPVRDILERVSTLPALAAQFREHSELRISATMHVPSNFLDTFAAVVSDLGLSSAEVAIEQSSMALSEKLIAGDVDLALIHLPAPRDGLGTFEWTRYPTAMAVRADDPLATRSSVSLSDLRNRAVVFSHASVHPLIAEQRRLSLERAGVVNLVELQDMGGSEIATHVWSRRLVALTSDVPESIQGRVFSGPDFAIVPLSDHDFEMSVGIAWPITRAEIPSLKTAVTALRRALPEI